MSAGQCLSVSVISQSVSESVPIRVSQSGCGGESLVSQLDAEDKAVEFAGAACCPEL